jgi:peroxiredoxin-like protein
MQELPHQYRVTASTDPAENVILKGEDLPEIVSAPPKEFGGPGSMWSPEELLAASVADCFVLTFRAVAEASRLDWVGLEVSAEGLLERVERVTRFTRFTVFANLVVAEGTDPEKARRLLEKAEAACMITNSLSAETHLETEVTVKA